MKLRLFEIIKFYIGSIIGNVLGYGLYYILIHYFGVWYISSFIYAFILNCIIGFVVKKFWVFRDKNIKIIKRQLILYTIISIIYFGVETIIVLLLVESLHIQKEIAPIVTAIFLSFVSYVVNKKFTFPN